MRKIFVILILVLLVNNISCTKSSFSNQNNAAIENQKIFKNVINRLLNEGIDTNFIFKLISNSKTQFDEKYVKINVTGYLTPTDYSHFYNQNSIYKAKEFLQNNYETLDQAEKKFNVPKEVITSILWIETRFGNYLGTHHLLSVFLSTAMCNEPEYIELNKKEIELKFPGDSQKVDSLKRVLDVRTRKKANWAIEELLALEKMHSKYRIQVGDLYGSWAGAFGICQFLPSSFVKYAIDGNKDGIIDLFNTTDAIFSVANYLNKNGWGKTQDEQRKAVFAYNNSGAYVNAVLQLSSLIK